MSACDFTLGSSHYVRWTTSDPATGAAANPSAQTVVVREEGTDSPIETLTPVNVATGRYKALVDVIIGTGYENEKLYHVEVDATVGGVACKGTIFSFMVFDYDITIVGEQVEEISTRIPAALVGGRINASLDATGFTDVAVDLIYDELLAGHLAAGSAGKALRDVAGMVLRQAQALGGAYTYIDLDAAAPGSSGHYDGSTVSIIGGTGAGQSRVIVAYVTTNRRAYVWPRFKLQPDNTSVFIITPGQYPGVMAGFVSAVGGTNTVTVVNQWMSASDDSLIGATIAVITGGGNVDCRIITDYAGGGLITVDEDWINTPNPGDIAIIYAAGRADLRTVKVSAINSLVAGRVDASVDATGFTSAAVANVWARVIEIAGALNVTAEQALRAILDTAAADTAGFPGSPIIKSLDGSKNRIEATLDINRNRTVTGRDLT